MAESMEESVGEGARHRALSLLAVAAIAVAATALLYTIRLIGGAGGEHDAVVVYRGEVCNGCDRWLEALQTEGFEVSVVRMPDIRPLQDDLGVPGRVRSCHVSVVGGYVLDGNVPIENIRQLLRRESPIRGLATRPAAAGEPGPGLVGFDDERRVRPWPST